MPISSHTSSIYLGTYSLHSFTLHFACGLHHRVVYTYGYHILPSRIGSPSVVGSLSLCTCIRWCSRTPLASPVSRLPPKPYRRHLFAYRLYVYRRRTPPAKLVDSSRRHFQSSLTAHVGGLVPASPGHLSMQGRSTRLRPIWSPRISRTSLPCISRINQFLRRT